MDGKLTKDKRVFEVMLIIVILGMTALFTLMGPYRMVALNLFFVPIILSAYFVGRTSAGMLALLCVLCVTVTTTAAPTGFAAFGTPLMVGLALAVWCAVLGLTAILVGTLCDERAATVKELHRAYVGVVEVLSKYLQGGNPHLKTRSTRIAELGQMVAEELKLPQKQVDDIRVAALLYELGNVEITTQVISKAFDTLEASRPRHTFLGTDLVESLSSVLDGALPLLAGQDEAVRDYLTREDPAEPSEMPIGARVIRVVRAYDDAAGDAAGEPLGTPANAVKKLREDVFGGYDNHVVDALERVLENSASLARIEPALL